MVSYSGKLFIVSAPSGCGKSSLITQVLQQQSRVKVSISHTTRLPRPGEIDHQHYHFVSKDNFQQLIAEQSFIEWAQVFDNFYGTSKQQITDQLIQGIDIFLDIDWQGARQIKQNMPIDSVISIFILPPSITSLKQRLMERGQDSEATIQKRMQQAQSELKHYNEFDHLIINDHFDQAVQELQSIILAYRTKRTTQEIKQQQLIRQLLAKAE